MQLLHQYHFYSDFRSISLYRYPSNVFKHASPVPHSSSDVHSDSSSAPSPSSQAHHPSPVPTVSKPLDSLVKSLTGFPPTKISANHSHPLSFKLLQEKETQWPRLPLIWKVARYPPLRDPSPSVDLWSKDCMLRC